jgi:nicotinamidase-related amidase
MASPATIWCPNWRRCPRDGDREAGRARPATRSVSLQQQGIGHLVFAGVTTEVCVQTTMREANDRGYECLLAEDATESYFPEFKAATLAMIRAQGGIVGWTAPTDTIVEALR